MTMIEVKCGSKRKCVTQHVFPGLVRPLLQIGPGGPIAKDIPWAEEIDRAGKNLKHRTHKSVYIHTLINREEDR
jgi:hypothetical protein